MPKYAIPASILYTAISRSSDFIRVLILNKGSNFFRETLTIGPLNENKKAQLIPASQIPTRNDKFKEWHDDSMMQKYINILQISSEHVIPQTQRNAAMHCGDPTVDGQIIQTPIHEL